MPFLILFALLCYINELVVIWQCSFTFYVVVVRVAFGIDLYDNGWAANTCGSGGYYCIIGVIDVFIFMVRLYHYW